MESARLSIVFKDNQFIPRKRIELYSNIEMLALLGGLLALFLGASIMSILEIIYFCILKLLLLRPTWISRISKGRS